MEKTLEKKTLYYNIRSRDFKVKIDDLVLLGKHWSFSRRQKSLAKFLPKFVDPFNVLELRNNNFLINFDIERMVINDQLRVYKFRESGSYVSQLSCSFSQIPYQISLIALN